MKKITFLLIISCLTTISSLALAAPETPEIDLIKSKLVDLVPNSDAVKVTASDVPNVYLLNINGQLTHAYQNGNHILFGELIDSKSKQNLTADAKSDWIVTKFKSLDTNTAVTFGPKDAKRSVFVFTDVDCGYCRKFHQADVSKLADAGIQVHYLAYPRAGLGSINHKKLENVWCSDDQQAALTAAKQGVENIMKTCDSPVIAHYELGQQVGLRGTPAMVLDDGSYLPGYRSAEQLIALMK